MGNIIFVAALAGLFSLFLVWGFRVLTREDWQIALATPAAKLNPRVWTGTNYTYYGVFQAIAFTVSAALLYVLVAGLPLSLSFGLAIPLMGAIFITSFCGARVLARIVEHKKHTLTIAGAFFVGFLLSPWLVLLTNRVANDETSVLPIMPLLAAGMATYAIGEGLGRLACISFGCCYGKPVCGLNPFLQRIFRGRAFVFSGETKKIAYEARLDGTEVVPIQAITAVFLVSCGLIAVYLFLTGRYGTGFLVSTISSQAWRYVSEKLRADHRGSGTTSPYQIMAVVSIAYAVLLWAILPQHDPIRSDLLKGLSRLWDPAAVLVLQGLGLMVFLLTGKSSVTESSLSFRVREDRV